MSKRLGKEYVYNLLKSKGWVLLEFVSTREPLLCKCNNGHVQYKRYFQFKNNNVSCLICNKKHSTCKLDIGVARRSFSELDLHLLDSVYVNSTTAMSYVCNVCGFRGKKPLYVVRNLKCGCPNCSGKLKYTFDEVKYIFEYNGFTLIDSIYSNNNVPMLCRCDTCYSKTYKTLSQVLHGSTCVNCYSNSRRLTFEEVKRKFSDIDLDILSTKYINNKQYLKYRCNVCGYEGEKRLVNVMVGYGCPNCANIKKSNLLKGYNSKWWKGGVTILNLPLFDTYHEKLVGIQHVHKITKFINNEYIELLGVECHLCGKVFVPKLYLLKNRIAAIEGRYPGEQNLYCSETCKNNCSTYKKQKHIKDSAKINYRTHQGQWSKLVKSASDNKCSICGTNTNLVAHHEIPVAVNGLVSADVDNGLVLCKQCHYNVHKLPWCNTSYLKNYSGDCR